MALRACNECGEKISSDPKTCPECGKRQKRAGLGSGGAIAILILIGAIGAMLNCDFDEGGNSGGTGAPSSVSNPQPTPPKFARPNVPTPQYRLYRQGATNGLVSVVVSHQTTDEQIKSLLWFFREKVRSHQLTALGITQKLESSGIIIIYRGEKCANEEFINELGPCGYGDHNDAQYQWGINGDPNHDAAGLKNSGGAELDVFDSSDNWQLPPAEQNKMVAQRKQREDFAVTLGLSFQQEGLDVTPSVEDDTTLSLDSKSFEDGPTRRAFIQQFLASRETVNKLCGSGFRNLQVGYLKGILAGYVGNRISLNCH